MEVELSAESEAFVTEINRFQQTLSDLTLLHSCSPGTNTGKVASDFT